MKKLFFFLFALIISVNCSNRNEKNKQTEKTPSVVFNPKSYEYCLSEIKSKKKNFPTQHVLQITNSSKLPLNTNIRIDDLNNSAIDPEHLKTLESIDVEYIKILEIRTNHKEFDDATEPPTRFQDFYNYLRFNAWFKEYMECNDNDCATRYETRKKRSIMRMWKTYFIEK
ncbi:MAG: hypothetical protein Q4A00_07070 [Flavobacteriaceae bacterium]|nr:hypothetical protein [Flavobacteriaceae bacterium]